MDYKLLSKGGVADLLTVSLPTVDRLRKQGGFPEPTYIGGSMRWKDTDIAEWLDQRINEEDR